VKTSNLSAKFNGHFVFKIVTAWCARLWKLPNQWTEQNLTTFYTQYTGLVCMPEWNSAHAFYAYLCMLRQEDSVVLLGGGWKIL